MGRERRPQAMEQGLGVEEPSMDAGDDPPRNDAESGNQPAGGPLSDVRAEGERVLKAADAADVVVRQVGGLAVYLRCPSAHRPPLQRDYKDIDLVGRGGDARAIGRLMEELGYFADAEFNSLHGHQRLYFWDQLNQRQLDVFIESISMCHHLSLTKRLELDSRTLTLADLLLTKLQVIEVNEKDLKDAAALLADHEVSPGGIDPLQIVSILAIDWGWWRTATANLRKVSSYAESLPGLEMAAVIQERVTALLGLIEGAPKSFKWKLRARVGERVRWYDLPEEIEG